jgi:hypothetical protein
MKRIFVFLLGVGMMIGCKKEKDLNINMTLNQSGNLIVKVADSTGAAIANTNVKLMQSSGISSSPLEEKSTDGNGNVSFENLLEGDYYVYLKKVVVSGKTYTIDQDVQVISGKTKSVNINPQTYVGSIQYTFNDNTTYPVKPIKGYTVVLFRYDDYNNLGSSPTFTSIKDLAFATGTTDSTGKVLFLGVPAGPTFLYMIFNSTKKSISQYSTYYLSKGDEDKISVTLDTYDFSNL